MMENKLEISYVIIEYYNIIKPFLKYKSTEIIENTCNKILNYIISCYGCDELKDNCFETINETKVIKTIDDATIFSLNNDLKKEENLASSIKSKIIINENIKSLDIFNEYLFVNDLIVLARKGDINACKLFGILNYLGIFADKNIYISKLVFTMLFYTGDSFSMKCLKCIYSGNNKSIKKIDEISNLYNLHYKTLTPFINIQLYDNHDQDVVDTVYIMLCYQQRMIVKKIDYLEILLLYYIVVANCDIDEKINEICNYNNDGSKLMINYLKYGNKKYGF